MKIVRTYPTDSGVAISLSRRNLEELLDMLNRAVEPNLCYLYKVDDQSRMLQVIAEENDVHYERVQTELE